MEQLPKIVRRGLEKTPKPGIHPDPDLLTAFAEKSLNDRDRSQVLLHLADCADCREIVSLAMPEIVQAPSARPETSSWLAWPMLRWGALAACVVVVSAAVTLHYQQRLIEEPHVAERAAVPAPAETSTLESRDQMAKNAAAPPVRDLGAAPMASPPPSDKVKTEAPRSRPLEDQTLAKRNETDQLMSKQLARADEAQSVNKPSMSAGVSGIVKAPAAPEAKIAEARPQSKDWNSNLDSAAAVTNETVTLTAEAPPVSNAQAAVESSKATGKDDSRKKSQLGGAVDVKELPAPTRVISNLGVANRITPKWTLSAAGELQRSFDSGKTWQTIPVASDVVFRALAANESDIWVGGNAGALYHSSDAGQHWTQVKPVANGTPLTDDILTVEFSDRVHGKLTTSNRETWTTDDAGNNWQNR